jgi:outer membrane biosynthesis protein TonB
MRNSKIETAGHLREFLAEAITLVKSGALPLERADRIHKLAGQINESFYAETQAAVANLRLTGVRIAMGSMRLGCATDELAPVEQQAIEHVAPLVSEPEGAPEPTPEPAPIPKPAAKAAPKAKPKRKAKPKAKAEIAPTPEIIPAPKSKYAGVIIGGDKSRGRPSERREPHNLKITPGGSITWIKRWCEQCVRTVYAKEAADCTAKFCKAKGA